MKTPFNAVTQVLEIMLRIPKAKRATKFLTPTQIVRTTRRHKGVNEFVLKIGSPNYLDRDFIKACRKAGEPFPVKRVQIQMYPIKKPTKKAAKKKN